MFTGIIQSVGVVTALNQRGGDVELCIQAPQFNFQSTALGDSIACSGCCLTVTKFAAQSFFVDVSRESLQVTTLKAWRVGTEVNLESALRAGDALGGHYVSGHVDGIGEVLSMHDDGRSLRVEFFAPKSLGHFVARKGSICVDGVSLTVNGVSDIADGARFDVNLIPHTLEQTTLRNLAAGAHVNLEIDMIARYLERMQSATAHDAGIRRQILAV